MKIDQVLKGLRTETKANPTEKTASTTAPAAPTRMPPKSALQAALAGALETAKTASETASPVDDVMKIAQEMADAERDANVKEAQLMGIAFMDAAISRLEQWQKTASTNFPASVSDDQLKQAAEAGYKQAISEMEKRAQEEYERGYNETVEYIHKVASIQFMHAAKQTSDLIKTLGR